MSYATCQRCGKPGREERWNERVRTLGICFVCGYGDTEPGTSLTRGERAAKRLNHNGYRNLDLFADPQNAASS